MKNAIIVIVIIALVVLGFWYFSGNNNQPAVEGQPAGQITNDNEITEVDDTSEGEMPESEIQEFNLTATSFKYDITEIRVKQGETVRINLTATQGFHDWVIDEFGAATKQLQAGESDSVEFVASQTGEFEYYCSVGNHRQMGMVGKLIVE
jgi:cytochrome c oxidase subunit 2